MSKTLISFFVAVCLFAGLHAFGSGTNTVPSLDNADAVNAFLQIQAQLHETEMEVESNRQQTVSALQQNANRLATNILLLEQNIADERVNGVESARKVEQTMLLLAGVGMLALAAVVTMVFLQLRTATRLIELAMSSPQPLLAAARPLPVVETPGALPASARAALEFSNARLLGVIDRLERRILDLEHAARAPLAEPPAHPLTGDSRASHRVGDLVVEGQLFLDTNKLEKAISCFDAALQIQPDMAEALIKKAAALEKMERLDEALSCYDRAIESKDSATTALLQKGGLLNRMARYEDALQCYEQALRTQEKKADSQESAVNGK